MAKKVLIGLDKFYYSLLTTDTTAGVSYQTPVALKGAITVAYNPNSEVATLFADDGPYDTAETIGEIELEVGIADISQEDYAALLGHTITGGVMAEDNNDQPVDCAFGFRAKRSNSGFSYYWFLKGKFTKPSMDHNTKGDKISWQTPSMLWKGVARVYDGNFKYSTRDDADDYTSAIGTAWFSSVYGTTADTTAPTFASSLPVSGSATAGATTNVVVTMSEDILSSSVTAANIFVICATAALTISAALSVSGAAITISTSANLTASTAYNVLIGTGIRDTAGIPMTGSKTFRFTTSA